MTLLFLLMIGLAVGSFLNVLVDRLPKSKSILGRSHCDHCGQTLGVVDLVPLVSYIAQGGRCRYCGKKIHVSNLIVELVTGALFVVTWVHLPRAEFGAFLRADQIVFFKLAYMGIVSSLIVTFFSDLKYRIIPDETTVSLVIFSIPVAVVSFLHEADPLKSHVVAGLALMLTIYFLYFVTRGRGMGFGDVKLAFAIGFLLGLGNGFLALYVAFILGGVVSALLIVSRRAGLKSKIAFGPFLVLGVVVMLFFEAEVRALAGRMFGL